MICLEPAMIASGDSSLLQLISNIIVEGDVVDTFESYL
jgi:hypothetical protein